jgi:hypothetical protein
MDKELKKHIESIKGKLKAENIDLQDNKKAIDCLSHTAAPVYCIKIYNNFIYKSSI